MGTQRGDATWSHIMVRRGRAVPLEQGDGNATRTWEYVMGTDFGQASQDSMLEA